MRHAGLPKGQTVTNDELNELYAIHVDRQPVAGHAIPEVDEIQGEKFLTMRKVPDYVASLGRTQVRDRLKQKGVLVE